VLDKIADFSAIAVKKSSKKLRKNQKQKTRSKEFRTENMINVFIGHFFFISIVLKMRNILVW